LERAAAAECLCERADSLLHAAGALTVLDAFGRVLAQQLGHVSGC